MSNAWEEKARLEKANTIAAYLFRYIQKGQITLGHIDRLDSGMIWQAVAAEAGANAAKPPSEATRIEVRRILRAYLPTEELTNA